MNRRSFLASCGGAVIALAGCASSPPSDAQQNTRSTPTTVKDGSEGEPVENVTMVEVERSVSKNSFVEAYVREQAPSNATVHDYGDESARLVAPVRHAVKEAVQSTDGIGNAGIASEEEKEAIQQIWFVRYQGVIVEVRVMTLN